MRARASVRERGSGSGCQHPGHPLALKREPGVPHRVGAWEDRVQHPGLDSPIDLIDAEAEITHLGARHHSVLTVGKLEQLISHRRY